MNQTSRRRSFRALCLAIAGAIAFAAAGGFALIFAEPAGADPSLTITSPANGDYWGISQGTVSGTAKAGDQVSVTTSQDAECSATADGTTGVWSCVLTGLGTAPAVTIHANDEDSESNNANVSISVVDPPTITAVTGANQQGQTFRGSNGQPTISGTSEPGATIVVNIGHTSCPSTTADAEGNWSCTTIGSVDPGFQYGTAVLGMLASQQPTWASQPSDYIADTYDYSPPLGDPVFSSPVDTSGGTPATGSTSKTVPTLAGTAAPNAHVNITYSGPGVSAFDDACDTMSNPAGHFSCTFAGDIPLAVGNQYLFRAEQITETNGSSSGTSPLFYLNILAPPPAPTIVGPSVPYSSTLTTVNISGTAEDASSVQTIIDGKNSCRANLAGGAWGCAAAKLSVGTHTLTAYSIDQWGTRGPSSQSRQFTIKAASLGGPLVLTGNPPAAAVPTPTPTPTPAPTQTAAPSPAPTTAPDPIHQADGPTHHAGTGKAKALSLNAPISFSSNLGTIGNAIKMSPAAAGVTGGVAAGFLGLVVFPSELLENTIRANYEIAFRWLSPTQRWLASARKRTSRFRVNPWIGGTLIILVAAFILGFASHEFGFNGSSVRLFAGLVISLAAVNLIVPGIMSLVAKKWYDVSVSLRPLPAALLLVLASALVSRIADINPGFLFAGIIGVTYAGQLDKKREGVLTLISTGLTVVLGLGAWLGYSAIYEQARAHAGFWNLLLAETFSATTIVALATLVIALLPFKFLDGSALFNWKPWVWVVSYLVSLIILIFVIAPISDNWGPETAPLVGWTVFFVIFAIVAVGVWAAFRFRPGRTGRSEE